jgi:hypothetical protein
MVISTFFFMELSWSLILGHRFVGCTQVHSSFFSYLFILCYPLTLSYWVLSFVIFSAFLYVDFSRSHITGLRLFYGFFLFFYFIIWNYVIGLWALWFFFFFFLWGYLGPHVCQIRSGWLWFFSIFLLFYLGLFFLVLFI